jgi:ATPase involved in DNA replication initiation
VEEGLSGRVENPSTDIYGQVLLGGEEFKERVKRLFKGQSTLSEEIVERKRFKGSVDAQDVVRAVAGVLGVEEDEVKRKRSRDNRARKVAIYLVKRYSGLSNEEIGEII